MKNLIQRKQGRDPAFPAGEPGAWRVRQPSMKWQMIGIMLLCWMIPFAFMIGILGVYLASNHSDMTAASFERQLEFNNKICVERINAAVSASRRASYDGTLLSANRLYRTGQISYVQATREYQSYLTGTYQNDTAVSCAMLWFDSDEEELYSVYNEKAGGTYQQIRQYQQKDQTAALKLAESLGTGIGFLYRGNVLYLIRNLMDEKYVSRGILTLRLDAEYCFDSLTDFPSGDGVYVTIGQTRIPLVENELLAAWSSRTEQETRAESAKGSGYEWSKERLFVRDSQKGDHYTLCTEMLLQKQITPFPFYGYPYVLGLMLFLLIPMFWLMLHVFRRQVSGPVAMLSEGARRIEEGELGYQVTQRPGNLEFSYLTDSMNQMSAHLKQQFDKIYQEEIALREARIKALQSHINPHFLNNTLEIINWEARLGGNIRVSNMIGALSRVLDAAMDRRRNPVVKLSEEMGYVNAYLYIIKERFGDRLCVEQELPPELMDYPVPRLILQPVIENAVEHGVVPNSRGTIVIRGYTKDGFLYLEIINDGGLTQEDKERIQKLLDPDCQAGKEKSVNLGIANVNQRLRILYGEPCGLTITEQENHKVTARLTVTAPEREA